MNRGIYSTAIGMIGAQRALDVTANNLANASTSGFKRDGLIFQDTLQREMYANGGTGAKVGVLGSGAQAVEEYSVQELGVISSTNNNFDMAINAPVGMFAVKVSDTQTSYTRDGALALDDQRRLVTKTGYPVLDKDGAEITIPSGPMHVEANGEIIVDGKPVAQVGVWVPNSGAKFMKEGENLFSISGGTARALDESPIAPASLEGSNVNAVESMLDMIKIARLFELSQKSTQQQDDLMQRPISSLTEQ